MLDFSNSQLDNVVVHFVGASDQENTFSDSALDLSDPMLEELLRSYFLKSFKGGGFYSFAHDSDLSLNELFSYCQAFFDGKTELVEFSRNVVVHLAHVSTHPNIKSGEFYVAFFTDLVVEGELVDAIGLFKSERKDRFIKVNRENGTLAVRCEFGTNPKYLDKGCLIFNTEKELGYKLSVIDNTNRDEAKYWVEDFLRVVQRNDNFYRTKTAIDLCKGFAEDVVNPNNNFEKLEQAEILTRAKDFFKSNETFSQEQFEDEVIGEPEVVEAFREYKRSYESELGCEIPDQFTISADATKQAQRYFKSVIKLDRNFHLYIHGKREWVERGYDSDKGMNFYKLYFEKES